MLPGRELSNRARIFSTSSIIEKILVLIFWFAVLASGVPRQFRWSRSVLIGFILVSSIVLNLHKHSDDIINFKSWQEWETVSIHQKALELREQCSHLGEKDIIISLSPHLLAEADLNFCRYFSTGIFTFRIGDQLSRSELDRYNCSSPGTVLDLLDSNPPAGFLLGISPSLETPFLKYVDTGNYQEIPSALKGYKLFLNNRSN